MAIGRRDGSESVRLCQAYSRLRNRISGRVWPYFVTNAAEEQIAKDCNAHDYDFRGLNDRVTIEHKQQYFKKIKRGRPRRGRKEKSEIQINKRPRIRTS